MIDAMRVHEGEVAQAARDFFHRFLEEVDRMDKEVTVEGGWAVAIHGSPIPSVDLDILIRCAELADDREYYDLLHCEGKYADELGFSAVDWSCLEEVNRAWADARGYSRTRLLSGRTVEAVVKSGPGRTRRVRVPTVPALLVMKLKALRDRSLQHRIAKDHSLLASYDPTDVAVISRDPQYRLRKTAKDLVDVGFLWLKASPDERQEAVALLREFELAALVQQEIAKIDPDVMAATNYLLRSHRLAGTAEAFQTAITEALAGDA